MKFCPHCAAPVVRRVPPGDNRERHMCDACGAIHYHNPRVVLGTIPVWENKVLLCKRAIEPRYGYWTLPAGFMEIGESTGDGAARETMEEAGARIELGSLFSVIDVTHVEQVHMFFLARLVDLDYAAGPESLEVGLFEESEIPWPDIAFRTVGQTLRWFFEDRSRGSFGLHTSAIHHSPRPAPA